MPATSCTGAILIGGASSRMGSPKHDMKLPDGRTMLEHMGAAVAGVCARVVIVGSAEQSVHAGYPVVRDLRPGVGPLGGIEALLASSISTQYLVCPCDTPLITSELLGGLLRSDTALASAFQIEGSDQVQPLPVRLRADVLPIVRRLLNSHHRSMWRLVRECTPDAVPISASQGLQLHNVNTPEDFEHARNLLQQPPTPG